MDEDHPEYTEFGIKIHKLRFTLKVQRRQQQQNRGQDDDPSPLGAAAAVADGGVRPNEAREAGRRAPNRSSSRASSLADSLRLLDLDPTAGSRRGLYYRRCGNSEGPARFPKTTPATDGPAASRSANWEFEGFYNSPSALVSPTTRVATPSSSGYGSTAPSSAALSRSDSFSGQHHQPQAPEARVRGRLALPSADDSVYSDVYSTIDEEEGVGADPFEDVTDVPKCKPPKPPVESVGAGSGATSGTHHSKTPSNASSTSTLPAAAQGRSRSSSQTTLSRFDFPSPEGDQQRGSSPPPLPPRTSQCRPPARPPYPSSIVRAVQQITQPIAR